MSPSNDGPKRFRLEQVLKHASRREEQAQMRLGTAAAEERTLREQLGRLREHEQAQLRSLAESGRQGAISPAKLDAGQQYLTVIEGSITQQLDVVDEVQARVLETREQLVAILQEKRSLENLKRKQLARAVIELDRREAREADDMTATRFVRRAREA